VAQGTSWGVLVVCPRRERVYGIFKTEGAAASVHWMKTLLLLICSNLFMTAAWYGQLKWKWFEGKSLVTIILVSWGIAFFEYCLMVPANRGGYLSGEFSGYQLKIMQECITLAVFVVFAWFVLKEKLTWNYAVSFTLIVLAVWFAMAVKPGGAPPAGH
jgi:uncharacterized protein (DUF486 family)